MKKLFYTGLLFLFFYEFFKVYLIMPMPGSQEMESISIAYFLHQYRWVFRILFVLMIVSGVKNVLTASKKWLPISLTIVVTILIYLFNFPMSADHMFLQPAYIKFNNSGNISLNKEAQIIGVTLNGESKAYPISYLVYHHQVIDEIGGQTVMVTYCSVCRTGRVYSPELNGERLQFRLVGMDHFNAMFEDTKTKSWWRQSTGEAITGSLKGSRLPEVPCVQMSIEKWLLLYPNGLVMQADTTALPNYDTDLHFEQGKSKSSLTGTDSSSWNKKSWVIGIVNGSESKAYDWNYLKIMRVINDRIGNQPIMILLANDDKSFVAYIKPDDQDAMIINDSILYMGSTFNFAGKSLTDSVSLTPVKVYQEFWHSWKTFHPDTKQFPN